jgi:hypothetical protein
VDRPPRDPLSKRPQVGKRRNEFRYSDGTTPPIPARLELWMAAVRNGVGEYRHRWGK